MTCVGLIWSIHHKPRVESVATSNGPGLGNHDVGVAVEVWCRGDIGGQAPSSLTLTLGWGWAFPPRMGISCSLAMGGTASHRLGLR